MIMVVCHHLAIIIICYSSLVLEKYKYFLYEFLG